MKKALFFIIAVFILNTAAASAAEKENSPAEELCISIINKDKAKCLELLKQEININGFYKGYSPIYYAAQSGDIDIVKILIEKKADIFDLQESRESSFDFYGETVSIMDIAEQTKNPEMIELIKNEIAKSLNPIDHINFFYSQYDKYSVVIYDKQNRFFGSFIYNYDGKKILSVKDNAVPVFRNKVDEKTLIRYKKANDNLDNFTMTILWVLIPFGILGLTGILSYVPGGILTGIAAYYFPDDFFNTDGHYYGTMGTAFLAVASACILIPAVYALIGLLIWGRTVYLEKKIIKKLNEGISFSYGQVKFKFDIALN